MEEVGYILVNATDKIISSVQAKNYSQVLEDLLELAGLSASILDQSDASIDSATVNGGYILIDYDCSEWVALADQIVKKVLVLNFTLNTMMNMAHTRSLP